MGAQSVTGVSGWGSAEGTSKGPRERNFVGVEKLIGPRIILAAQATIGGGGTVTYPFPETLNGGIEDFCITASAANAVTVTKVAPGPTFHMTAVTFAGTPADVVDFTVVNVGNSL